MKFAKYQHIERFGADVVEGIEKGKCYIFPKIDGTNSSVWMRDRNIVCGSRNRELSLDNDNAGFMTFAIQSDGIKHYLAQHPTHRLYGEWLVPHSLKTYRDTAWKDFYVFDVMDGEKYIQYDEYSENLKSHGVNFIPPMAIVENASYENFISFLDKNIFLIKDGEGSGEGIVIKRYDFVNKFGKTIWAKIVTSEFKEKHAKEMGCGEIVYKKQLEETIAGKYVTSALVEKEYEKIKAVDGWNGKSIPRLLNTVFNCIVSECMWDIAKEYKNPTINFATLQYFVYQETKQAKQDIF